MFPGSPPDGLFSGLFARGEAAARASESALLAALVEVEVALVRAQVRAGLAPPEAERGLDTIDVCEIDVGRLGRGSAESGTPIPALVQALREMLGDSPAATFIHRGATSQDVLDTAIMLVARRSLQPTLGELKAAAERCAALAEQHRGSIQAGRTLLQQAVPLTFGLKAAGWLMLLDGVRSAVVEARAQDLAVQLGGAAGTMASLGPRGLEVMENLAELLGLAEPVLPWHTNRIGPARLASSLGLALGAMSKVARDLVLLAQTEVGEATESGLGGGSSTMPHKQNPVGAIAVVACAQRAPGLVASIMGSMGQEHERAAGSWQAEWEPLLELLRLAGSAALALRDVLDRLELDSERMRSNLGLTRGLVMSESVAAALGEALGRPRARELVESAARRAAEQGQDLKDVLMQTAEVTAVLDRASLERALSPDNYLGATDELIDRALRAYRAD